jgi:hypothetical protein
MSEAGWGAPDWLPLSVRRAQYLEAQAEAKEAREAEAAREEAVEQRRAQALTQAAREAEARGEALDVMALARGEVRGRAISDVLTAAVEASAAADRGDQLRLQREGTGQPVHIEVGEPTLHRAPAARSGLALQMFHRSRRFFAARRAAAEAESARDASRDDWGILDLDYSDRSGWDRPARRRSGGSSPDVRFRGGGHITGVR